MIQFWIKMVECNVNNYLKTVFTLWGKCTFSNLKRIPSDQKSFYMFCTQISSNSIFCVLFKNDKIFQFCESHPKWFYSHWYFLFKFDVILHSGILMSIFTCVYESDSTITCSKSWIQRIFDWKGLNFVDNSSEAPEYLSYLLKVLQIINGKFETKRGTLFPHI